MKHEVQYQVADQITSVKLEQTGDQFRVIVGSNEYQVRAKQTADGRLLLEVDDQRRQLYVASIDDKHYVWLDGYHWILQKVDRKKQQSVTKISAAQKEATGILIATMPGLVRDVLVKEGDSVARGAPLVLLEAMKMELRVTATQDGQVSKVHCTPGQVVERGQRLVEISRTVSQ